MNSYSMKQRAKFACYPSKYGDSHCGILDFNCSENQHVFVFPWLNII